MLIGFCSREAGAFEETAANPTSTGSIVLQSSTSSTLQDYENEMLFGIFPSKPIATLTVLVRAYPDYGPDDALCVYYGPGGEVLKFHGETTLQVGSLPSGLLNRSEAPVVCRYYTHEPHGPMDSFGVVKVVGKDADGVVVETQVCALDYSSDSLDPPLASHCRQACGDAVCDGGEPKASDALAVLRAAVKLRPCALRICDTNGDETVTTVDAQRILRRAVGGNLIMLCPAPC